jgi:lactoylglutathione lyase
MAMPDPLFHAVDCLCLPVPELETGLAFYRDELGHELIWRTPTAAGLRLPGSQVELVLQTERPRPEVDLTVASVPASLARLVAAGGTVLRGPFEIAIGQCAVVQDPWGNELVLLDHSKGRLKTDAHQEVIGLE